MSSHISPSDRRNSSGFIINISKQLAFETQNLLGYDAIIATQQDV